MYDLQLPDNYVVPKAVLDATRRVHDAPPPVYKHVMDDLLLAIVAGGPGDVVFGVPAYVIGYPLYDAEALARWIVGALDRAGYSPELSSSAPTAQDMWPDRRDPCPSEALAFPYDEAEYVRALQAPSWTVRVPA